MKQEDIKRYEHGRNLLLAKEEIEVAAETIGSFAGGLDDILDETVPSIRVSIIRREGRDCHIHITPLMCKQMAEFLKEKADETVKQLEEEFETL